MLPWNRPWLGALISLPIQVVLLILLMILAVWMNGGFEGVWPDFTRRFFT